MFFLYTIVSYMIYLQLQILCILPLNPTLIKQYLYLCSKIWKINHLLEIENQLVMMVEAHYHYHQRWYKKIDTVELVSIITTHQVSNKKAKTSSPPYNELRGRELILKLINNIRGSYLFSQGRGSGSGAPEKNFAFPPRFLGGKGFQTVFSERLIPQEPNS